MTVGELIRELSKYEPSATVAIGDWQFDADLPSVPAAERILCEFREYVVSEASEGKEFATMTGPVIVIGQRDSKEVAKEYRQATGEEGIKFSD